MGNFEALFPIVLGHEVSTVNPTGLVDIPGDTGGVTKWGVSQAAWSRIRFKPEFEGFPSDVRNLTFDNALVIYKLVYFPLICDDLPLSVGLIVFDAEVNAGNGVKMLQRALKVTDDGIWGPVSQSALRLALRDTPSLVEEVLWQRLKYYRSISAGSLVNQRFLTDLWIPRLVKCREEAGKLGVN